MKRFLITGMHRSGTTLIGKLVALASPNISVLHEPFNYELGVKGVPCWYPSPCHNGLKDLVENVLNLDVQYKRWVMLRGENPVRSLGRTIIGGDGQKSFHLVKQQKTLFGEKHKLCVKDPFALLLTKFFSDVGVKSIVMVRHPAALYLSMKRMEWNFDFSHLAALKSHSLSEQLDQDIFLDKSIVLADQVALLWKTLYTIAYEQAKNDDNVMFIRHEDFCLDPTTTMKKVLGHLSLEYGDELVVELERLTSRGEGEAKGKRLHQMRRNSRDLAFSWHPYACDNDITKLKNRVGDRIQLFYKSWDEL